MDIVKNFENKDNIFTAITSGDIQRVLKEILNTPVAHVNRIEFLSKTFGISESDIVNKQANISFDVRKKAANKQINSTVIQTSSISFASGIPGGPAMAATIPGDILQNMVYSVRLAQQLAFIYDINIEANDEIDIDILLLFLGTMFGVNSAAALLRVTSTNTGKYLSKKILSAGLSKTVWFPIFKKIVRIVSGKTLTIKTLSKSATKIIPIFGGAASGGMTYFAMKKSAKRLNEELQKGFDGIYSEDDYQKDLETLDGEFLEVE